MAMNHLSGRMFLFLGAVAYCLPLSALAQDQFFRGKSLRIVVGFAAGGGFDTYSRAIARYWGRHIPGNPAFIVENMGGAGSLIAANHVYKVARPDGLTIGNFGDGLFMQQLKGGVGIADAKKSKIDLEPIDGEEVQKMVAGMFKLSPALVAKLRDALK